MNDADRAIVAAAEERDHAEQPVVRPCARDRRELLRIVRNLDALLRERDTLAEDAADDDAAERATESRWGR